MATELDRLQMEARILEVQLGELQSLPPGARAYKKELDVYFMRPTPVVIEGIKSASSQKMLMVCAGVLRLTRRTEDLEAKREQIRLASRAPKK